MHRHLLHGPRSIQQMKNARADAIDRTCDLRVSLAYGYPGHALTVLRWHWYAQAWADLGLSLPSRASRMRHKEIAADDDFGSSRQEEREVSSRDLMCHLTSLLAFQHGGHLSCDSC
jgi:hypothetical protein